MGAAKTSWPTPNRQARTPKTIDAMDHDIGISQWRLNGPGPTFMRACGLVNAHVTSCFRFKEIVDSYRS
jgi:3-methyladenine DNA glycosylase Tag